jgi:hypothetical protein
MLSTTLFAELRFWLLIAFSVVIPTGIYTVLLLKRAISRWTVLVLGLALIAIAGLDVYLLRSLAASAAKSAPLSDDAFFNSEVSLALYLLPAMFAGIGINLVAHVLVRHLDEAERQFRKDHPES